MPADSNFSSATISKTQAAKLSKAVLAYQKFMKIVRDLRKKEHKLFLDTIKTIEDEKIAQLRKKLSSMK